MPIIQQDSKNFPLWQREYKDMRNTAQTYLIELQKLNRAGKRRNDKLKKARTEIKRLEKENEKLHLRESHAVQQEITAKSDWLGKIQCLEYQLQKADEVVEAARDIKDKANSKYVGYGVYTLGKFWVERLIKVLANYDKSRGSAVRNRAGESTVICAEDVPATPQPTWVQVVKQTIYDIESSIQEGDVSLQGIMENLRGILPVETGVQIGEVTPQPFRTFNTIKQIENEPETILPYSPNKEILGKRAPQPDNCPECGEIVAEDNKGELPQFKTNCPKCKGIGKANAEKNK